MQEKRLTPFIREINPQYVQLMTYSNLTGLEWCTPPERATIVSFKGCLFGNIGVTLPSEWGLQAAVAALVFLCGPLGQRDKF